MHPAVGTAASSRRLARRSTVLAAAAAVALGMVAAGAPTAAQAGTCSSQTGGSSDTLMWTGSTYTCAYAARVDDNKIGAWKTESWTTNTASGYTKRDECTRDSGGKVTFSNAYYESELTGSSFTSTVTNWEDGSRHYSIGVLWNTPKSGKVAGSQYTDTCKGNPYPTISMNLAKASLSGPASIGSNSSASYTVQVTKPDGGPTPTGKVALFKQLGDRQDPQGKNCDGSSNSGVDPAVASATLSNSTATLTTPTLGAGSYKFYATYTGTPVTSSGLPSYCMSPAQSGLTGAKSNSMSLTVGQASQTRASHGLAAAPARSPHRAPISVLDVNGRAPQTIKARCPVRHKPVQTMVGARRDLIQPSMSTNIDRGIKVDTASLPDGTLVHVQLVCRPAKAAPVELGRVGFGSARSDRMTTTRQSVTLLGGLAGDRLTVTRRHGVAFGGPGPDRLALHRGGAASGGTGRDVIRSRSTERVLLVGDAGRDRLIGGPGRTYINARDQAGGDRVFCKSRRTFVLADPGDILSGPCRMGTRRGLG